MTTIVDIADQCNLCKSKNYQVVIDGKFGKIVRCNDCHFMYRKTKLQEFSFDHVGDSERMDRLFQQKQKNQLRDYESCFKAIERYSSVGTDRSFLEIGSHTGEFLNLAKSKGWNVKGIEPDERVANISINKFGLDISTSFLRDTHFQSDHFEVIALFHVIEHFFEPLEELMEMYRIMKPGGILVIETPRYDTIWFRVLREHERSVIPDHYFYFTKESIKLMLQKAGFSTLEVDSVGRTIAIDRLFTNIAKVIGSNSFSKFQIKTADQLKLDRFTLYINTHDMMRVYAQKH